MGGLVALEVLGAREGARALVADVECIFDFGVTVGNGDSLDHDQAVDIFDYASDEPRSEPETTESEYSVKRRKTIHSSVTSTFINAASTNMQASSYLQTATEGTSSVSPHLLSAARLASSQTKSSPRDTPDIATLADSNHELSSADQLISMATFSNKGMQIPDTNSISVYGQLRKTNRDTGCGMGFPNDPMSHLYFPPLRDGSKIKSEGMRIAEEDLNAANTLQGINPTPSNMVNYRSGLDGPWKNNMMDSSSPQAPTVVKPIDMAGVMPRNFTPDYTNTNSSNYYRSPMFGGSSSLPPLSASVESSSSIHNAACDENSSLPAANDSVGLDGPDMNLEDDSFFFDFGIFDNTTDWLRDWGPNESISPESHAGMDGLEILETLPDATFVMGLTPNYGGDYISMSSANLQTFTPGPIVDDQPLTPKPAQDDGKVPPPTINVPGLGSTSPSGRDHANNSLLPWGWQQGGAHKDDPSRKVTLPPLRHVIPERNEQYGRHMSNPGAQVFDEVGIITEDMRKEMIQVLTLPSARPPYPGCEASEIERVFPNKEVIATFIKLYFDQFHPILPVIHRPTFCIDRCPSILLLAMISIGASYSTLKNAKAFADSLSELCKRYLAWMVRLLWFTCTLWC